MITAGRILPMHIALAGCEVASAHEALGTVEISTGSVRPCKTSHKASCLLLRIANHGSSVFVIPVSSFRQDVETVQAPFVRFESRNARAPNDEWTEFSTPWGDYTIFPDRVSVGPNQVGAVLVELRRLPRDRAGHEIRVVLVDEQGKKHYSNAFDASGNPESSLRR
jgi:hypothetical protein